MLSIINLQNYKLLFLPSLHVIYHTSFNSLVSLVAYMCNMKEEGSL